MGLQKQELYDPTALEQKHAQQTSHTHRGTERKNPHRFGCFAGTASPNPAGKIHVRTCDMEREKQHYLFFQRKGQRHDHVLEISGSQNESSEWASTVKQAWTHYYSSVELRKTKLLKQKEVFCLDKSLSFLVLCFQRLHHQYRRCQQTGALQPGVNPQS